MLKKYTRIWPGRVMLTVLLMLLTASCGKPMEQPHIQPSTPPELKTDVLMPGDGASLPVRAWWPTGKPKALVVALHGFNDYSNAFAGPGEYLSHQGIALLAYDQRGFGATKSHGIWAGRKNLVTDLKQMVTALKKAYPLTPIYVLGESMGGAVAMVAVTQPDFPLVNGVIVTAPAVWGSETMNSFYRSTLWLLAHTMPSKQLTGRDLKIQASDNIPMLQALGRDPLIIKETRVDAIYGIVRLMDEAYLSVPKVKAPMLLLYGGRDQVIPRMPISRAIAQIKAPLTVAYYPDGYHMLLRDLRAKVVLADIASWISNRYKVLPSGYDEDWRHYLVPGRLTADNTSH